MEKPGFSFLLTRENQNKKPAGFRRASVLRARCLFVMQARAKRSASDLPHGMDGNLRTLRTGCEHLTGRHALFP
jgi:hypothetical protein